MTALASRTQRPVGAAGQPSWKPPLIAFGVAAAVFVGTHVLNTPSSLHHVMHATGGQQILDMMPSFSADAVYERLTAFGETGRELYRNMVMSMDIVFPTAVFAFLFLLQRYASGRLQPGKALKRVLFALPFGFFVPDMIENISIYVMLSDFPQRHDLIASVIGYITVVKRTSFYAAVALPLGLLAFGRFRAWRNR